MTKLVHFDVGNKFVEPFVARNISFQLTYEECMWYITKRKGRKGDEILIQYYNPLRMTRISYYDSNIHNMTCILFIITTSFWLYFKTRYI